MQQNLKADLIQKFNQNKYFAEQELVRLATPATSSTIPYSTKLELIEEQIKLIAESNMNIALVNQYFQEAQTQQPTQPVVENKEPAQQQTGAHAGQSHGE